MLISIFVIICENRLILNSYLWLNFIKQNRQRPASVGDLQRYVTVMTSRQSYSLIHPNRISYVYV